MSFPVSARLQARQHGIHRRQVLQGGVAALAAGALIRGVGPGGRAFAQEATPVAGEMASPMAGAPQFMFVGSYTRAAVEAGADPATLGISVFQVDPATGALSLVETVESDNPSFVALDPTQTRLYAVNENMDYEGTEGGSVEAYAIDPATGMLTLINRVNSVGAIPAHLAVSPDGKHLIIANYIGKNYVVFPINDDGSLGEPTAVHDNEGSGPNPDRQEAPHPHATLYDPSGQWVATADLGIDKVQIFSIGDDGSLNLVSEVSAAAGAGPRHVAFNPEGTVLYVVNELDATIVSYAFDPATGQIGDVIQTVSTVPDEFVGTKSTAEIFVHPSGKFLYSSNRGLDDLETPEGDAIVAWSVDPATGELTLIGHVVDDVNVPRNFVIDPSGTWLYVANQEGSTIVQYDIDQESGALTPTGNVVETTRPVALVMTHP